MNAFFSSNSIPLIALHGWGMNASVWQAIEPFLPEEVNFLSLNLPGYGSTESAEMTMDGAVEWLSRQFEGRCSLLGWSMGGLLAQAFSHKYPYRVESLTLVASTPSFIQREYWACGLDESILKQFIEQLHENQNATIRRFISLQFMGESGTMPLQKQLRDSVVRQSPSLTTLDLGLVWLLHCDYRENLCQLPPQHWIFGGLDRLIPKTIVGQITQLVPEAKISYFEGCGHAPFLTQPERFTEKLLEFISHLKSN